MLQFLTFPLIIVFHCRQIQESYPQLFQQQDKTVSPVATATVIST